MSEPFLGEIRMFAGNFAPRGYAFCNGQLLAISQNDALFSLLGTFYGGDGRTTFGLPDLRGRIPIHEGSGPGLTPRPIGSKAGAENQTLTAAELPSHTHAISCSTTGGDKRSPQGALPAVDGTGATALYSNETRDATMNWPKTLAAGRGNQHANVQPFLCINFIIALLGIFPSRP